MEYLKMLEGMFVSIGLLGFLVWQYVSVSREIRKDREAKARRERGEPPAA